MSTLFIGGPADGVSLVLARAPMFLRVVVDRAAQPQLDGTLPDGAVDALDLVGDMPRPGEVVHVYELERSSAPMHWCGEDSRGRRTGGWITSARYRHLPDVDAEQLGLRDNAVWAQWATRRAHRQHGVADLGEHRERATAGAEARS